MYSQDYRMTQVLAWVNCSALFAVQVLSCLRVLYVQVMCLVLYCLLTSLLMLSDSTAITYLLHAGVGRLVSAFHSPQATTINH